MNTARYEHTATLLPNGKVLVAGGNGVMIALASAELYDPASGTWTTTGPLNAARYYHTATLLPNGKVLVAGGSSDTGALASAELYDPASGTWTNTGSLNTARELHTATLLPSGKVLVAGGENIYGYPIASAELYDPVSGMWTNTGSLSTAREYHTATLLPNGQVLVAGGGGNSGILTNAELYNPATGTWTTTGSLNTARGYHTATLLANGKVLVAGGFNNIIGGMTSSAELYDVGLGFDASWQPQIATVSLLTNGGCLTLTGSQFRGISEGSCGDTQDSPADYPVVQLRRLDNEQTLFLLTTNWSTNALTSAPVTNFPSGYALVTVFVNGIPSSASVLYVGPIMLFNPTMLPSGAYQFTFGNTPGVSFTALGTTNLALPMSSWTVLGSVTEVSPGQFEFADMQAPTYPQRFYRVRSP
jgi:hypothetical protein